MRIDQYLQSLIRHSEKSDLPQTFKTRVISALNYFLQQTLCDQDKRQRPEVIKNNWLEFELLLKGTSLLDYFKKDKAAWAQFRSQLGIEPITPPVRQRTSRFEGKDANELLRYLARKSEEQRTISDYEKNLMRVGLYYLETEAWKGRSQRNNQRIRFTWRLIQPIMRRVGLLDEFLGEEDAVRRIKAFISDHL